VGETLHGDRQSEYALFTEPAAYEVIDLERLRFTIESPSMDTVTTCNKIVDRQTVVRPLPVRVQVLNEANELADHRYCFTSDTDQTFEATLRSASGRLLDTIRLTAQTDEIGVFEGLLLETEPAIVGCGKVDVSVSFVGEYDAKQFNMPVTSTQVSLVREQAKGVAAEVIRPVSNTQVLVHPNFQSACACAFRPGRTVENVQTVTIELELTDLDGNALDPLDVALDAPESLYEVNLLGPKSEGEELTLRVEASSRGRSLVATGGLSVTAPGTYYFEWEARPEAFKRNFIPADDGKQRVAFERADATWNSPMTCRILMLSSLAVIIAVAGILIYLATGPLVGTVLVFTKER
jgi:hypothetical protein